MTKNELIRQMQDLKYNWGNVCIPVEHMLMLLENLEETGLEPVTDQDLEMIAADISTMIADDITGYVRDYDFSLSRNEIVVDGMDIETRDLTNDIIRQLKGSIDVVNSGEMKIKLEQPRY